MKKSRIFGAVFCSAALACSMAIPAFAAEPNPYPQTTKSGEVLNDTDVISGSAGASTSVDVWYNQEQISATIPIKVAIGVQENVDASNGQKIIAPDPAKYAIENKSSTSGIFVKTVKAADTGTLFALSNPSDLTSAFSGAATSLYGRINLTLKTTASTTTDLSTTVSTAWSAATSAATSLIAAAPGDKIPLELAGTSFVNTTKLGTDGVNDGADHLAADEFKITYTIAKAA